MASGQHRPEGARTTTNTRTQPVASQAAAGSWLLALIRLASLTCGPTAAHLWPALSQTTTQPTASGGHNAEEAAHSAQPPQDLRSPDTRDAAAVRTTLSTPAVTVVKAPPSAPPADGINWTDAGIGAASLLGLIAVGLAGTFSVLYRRRGGPARHRTATARQEGP
jgi:hypothetical protein